MGRNEKLKSQLAAALLEVKEAEDKARATKKQATAATKDAELSKKLCVAEVARMNIEAVAAIDAAMEVEKERRYEADLARKEDELAKLKKYSMAALKKHEEKSSKQIAALASKPGRRCCATTQTLPAKRRKQ